MVLNNTSVDPYHPTRGYYECPSCGRRTTSDIRIGTCPDCGCEHVRNIAVPRE